MKNLKATLDQKVIKNKLAIKNKNNDERETEIEQVYVIRILDNCKLA
jgi:hypothetical protein